MIKRWFVTGTDTEVGKTIASSALLQAANLAGYRSAGYKPVASGSEMTPQGLRNEDALALQRHSGVALSYEDVNPYTFAEPTSPHIVSADLRQPIEFTVMSSGLRRLEQRADWLLVEGAGGWFTPLSPTQSFADWVVGEQLPVILVVGMKLGCINHARLSARAIQEDGARLVGWIANEVDPVMARRDENFALLSARMPVPCWGRLPHAPDIDAGQLRRHISIPL